jgi:hypothetical protein
MPEGEWRVGREFTVIETINLDGMKFNRGGTYSAQAFGRIGVSNGGRHWAITNDSRRRLMDVIIWADAPPSRISPVLRKLIEQDPESPFIRAFVRTEIGLVPPRAETPVTAEKWFEYIEKAEPPQKRAASAPPVTVTPPPGADTAPATFTTTAAAITTAPIYEFITNYRDIVTTATIEGELHMPIRVEASQRVAGRVSFSRTDYYGGDLQVPARILAQGRDAVYAWARDNMDEMGPNDSGDSEYYDEETHESGSIEIEDNNIAQVVRDFQRLHPEMARRLAEEGRALRNE